jgi:methylglyoxal synthase
MIAKQKIRLFDIFCDPLESLPHDLMLKLSSEWLFFTICQLLATEQQQT